MTKSERSITKLMAAASVLGLSLGMSALGADTNQHKSGDQTVTQHKGETGEHKLDSGFLKHNTGSSDQIKWGPSNQDKHTAPSTQLNPQPEPPKPSGDQAPKH